MTPDFPRLALAARRCSAAYIMDEEAAIAAFRALGSVVLGRVSNGRRQAIAHRGPDNGAYVTIAGTRFSEGPISDRLSDLRRDIDWTPKDVGDGIKVATGADDGLADLWRWALGYFDGGEKINGEGHSLGGWETYYMPLHVPAERIGSLVTIEPPRPANAAYWARYADVLPKITTLAHGRDPWFPWAWGQTELRHPPGRSIIWLHDGGWSAVTEAEWCDATGLPEVNLALHESDHGPDSVVSALGLLARDLR